MEARSRFPEGKCFSAILDKNKRACFSRFLSNWQGSEQNQKGEMHYNCNNSSMANPTKTDASVKHVNTKPNPASTDRNFFEKCPRENASTSPEASIKTSGLDHISKSLSTTTLSKQAIELISVDRRKHSIISNSKLAWRKFCSWSCQQKVGPFRCDPKFFLTLWQICFSRNMDITR